MRLVDHLRQLGMSNRDARKALETGKVYVADVPTADPAREVAPERVSVRSNAPRVRVGLDPVVVYRDSELAVVWKPSGLLAVPARSRRGERSLLSFCRTTLGAALPVHRIDEGTSGLMVVARSEASQAAIKQLFFHHDIERRYLALVRGRFTDDSTTVDLPLARDRGDGLRGAAKPGQEAKSAITHFRLIEHLGRHASLVEARLETGRTHQVRIHAAHLGHPILGDSLYGDRVSRGVPRLALHAQILGFEHPSTGESLRFEAPLADDLERLARRLRGA